MYVGTSKGINLYNAAPNGKLTLVAGSPFKTTGLMIGSNQKFFITLGINWVRSYPVKANGAIGAQVSQINTQNYSGRDCGTTNGAILDHSGQDVYALLNVPPDGNNVCDAYQTFKIDDFRTAHLQWSNRAGQHLAVRAESPDVPREQQICVRHQ